MRHAVPVRRDLGVPTAFNFLGPLANPARVRRQVVGVGDPAMAEKMIGVLAAGGASHVLVVHGADGLDELSTTGASTMYCYAGRGLEKVEVDPGALGLRPARLADLVGGDAATNADMARRVLAGEPGPHRDIVALNAGAGLVVAGLAAELAEGLTLAAAAIDDGRAAGALERLIAVSQAY
jgi:anthranilate phosphoribosyltransferase